MDVLQMNGYPRNFLKRCLRRKPFIGNHVSSQEQQPTKPKTALLPYIKNVSEITARLLIRQGVFVAHKPTTSLRHLLSRPKDHSAKGDIVNSVYQIDCRDCNACYVGQSGRKLSTRIHEHRLAIRRHDHLSPILIHQDRFGREFDLESIKLLV